MTQLTPPHAVGQNIARAKSLIKRDEPVRALDCLIAALELFEPAKVIGKARYEVEVNILECVGDISRHPKVRNFLNQLTRSTTAVIAYAPGEEAKLLPVLRVLRKALHESEMEKIQAAQEKVEGRKAMLLEKGKTHLAAGENPRGKAVLRQLGDEYGTEPGILASIGALLVEAKLHYDAVEFLEQAVDAFPKDSNAYGALVNCYSTLNEFEKAEAVYLKAMRQFGQHPKTLLNLAKLYQRWNKKDKAYEVAQQICKLEPANAEARAIMDAVDKR